MFCGFYCIRKLLILLNLFYIFLSIFLVSISVYANSISIVSASIIGGIIFCGIFLLIIAFIGLIGTLRHHQVLLFFYMLTLSICFIVQFIVACASLSVISSNSKSSLLAAGWSKLSDETIKETQYKYKCCGFKNMTSIEETRNLCPPDGANKPCFDIVKDSVEKATKIVGAVSLTFSFIDLFGVWLAMRFRNLRDPKCNPNSFL